MLGKGLLVGVGSKEVMDMWEKHDLVVWMVSDVRREVCHCVDV